MGGFVIGWSVGVGLCALGAVWLGSKLTGSASGIFRDSRHTWSLSQLQLVLWTFLGIPLLVATAVWRATKDASTAWDFQIPGELLALMGISLGSAVSSLALKSTKDTTRPGSVGARAATGPHPFADMFAVEEGGSALRAVDVTKAQNFVITIAMLVSYLWIVLTAFGDLNDGAVPAELPAFSDSMVGLLALSHAGYLVGKVPNRQGDPNTVDPPDPAAPPPGPGAPPPATPNPSLVPVISVADLP